MLNRMTTVITQTTTMMVNFLATGLCASTQDFTRSSAVRRGAELIISTTVAKNRLTDVYRFGKCT